MPKRQKGARAAPLQGATAARRYGGTGAAAAEPKAEEPPPDEPVAAEDSDEECRPRRRPLPKAQGRRLKLQGVDCKDVGEMPEGWEAGLPPGWTIRNEKYGLEGAIFISPRGEKFASLPEAIMTLPPASRHAPGVGSPITIWYQEGKKEKRVTPYTAIVVRISQFGQMEVRFDEGSKDWVDHAEDEWAWGRHAGPPPSGGKGGGGGERSGSADGNGVDDAGASGSGSAAPRRRARRRASARRLDGAPAPAPARASPAAAAAGGAAAASAQSAAMRAAGQPPPAPAAAAPAAPAGPPPPGGGPGPRGGGGGGGGKPKPAPRKRGPSEDGGARSGPGRRAHAALATTRSRGSSAQAINQKQAAAGGAAAAPPPLEWCAPHLWARRPPPLRRWHRWLPSARRRRGRRATSCRATCAR